MIVLVEGVSDQIAVDTLAQRLGGSDTGVAVLPVGGAQGLRRMLRTIRADHPAVPLSGLYDIAEAHVIRRALEDAGLLGPDTAIEDAGFGALLISKTSCCAPAGRISSRRASPTTATSPRSASCRSSRSGAIAPIHAQLRRWMTSGARRKLRYARIFVDAIPLERMPEPLLAVLQRARQT